jgi:phospholipid-binding lipoprotein MlaA
MAKTNLWYVCILTLCLLLAGMAQADTNAGDVAVMLASAEAADGDVPFDPFDDPDDPFADADSLQTVADPISGYNRVIFAFNDKLYFWVLKPVALGYRTVMPTPVRVGIKNFMYNLLAPVRFVNCLLQGKGEAADGEFGRFLVNTTAGLGGLFNPAKNVPEYNPPPEDFGQTLGYHHVGNGFYIVWPVIGPCTLRDTVGRIGDWALNPLNFMQLVDAEAGVLTEPSTGMIVYGVDTINDTSFRIGDYEALKNSAIDPYEAFRNAYIQNRNSKIAQ